MNIFLFLGLAFFIVFILGFFLEKIKIPWIFAALILGLFLSFNQTFFDLAHSANFEFMAKLGIYFLLFSIGFEFDLVKIRKLGNFIVKSTFFIIFFEAFFGSLLIHFVFGYGWLVAILVALSFATVGEAILIPILDEFKLIKTKLGQSILGIGTLDDLIEVAVIVVVVLSLPFLSHNIDASGHLNFIWILVCLFIFSFVLSKLHNKVLFTKFAKVEYIFFLVLTVFLYF
ncbi:MAG: hypothetical protein COV55_00330 [Candidatus Komeilibacteria bacterium CG11_big_fil_rev_8_21_14_0_20_36_20]|uniref:Cation/H+ exchanger transmembrane domain-containing protein n=1 Tax=Candidatus Komeilibacteria bacterium CG11_big_fil_rev_8_21_14_0_20_36_20 TaxID=1974477 RepID=A0A2H0NEE0_9BACT|nr:MAG: hypothetical protein COV55_00330 [Candidatus Komeilibacteria bacterium CG11_big_fil_rev_8_21_14_0_20_36_20]PIR82101.1 MAG: hypothetical protein COU21_00025 [Candidatus Komeilibacteria bacterium CG10_big_fil_rev_8_21_14_0_10_36_65]PJC55773.1 MAG: hypothetical protein CO027_00225 [Candidatus Komeilibacteria bacterium CG_4_9_14_0_2_um_filter_36_13]